jgi:hypothetical protein
VPRRWHRPTLRRVLLAWVVLTLAGCAACVIVLRSMPQDEGPAGGLGLQVMLALLGVGLPALTLLFLALFVDALLRRERPGRPRRPGRG